MSSKNKNNNNNENLPPPQSSGSAQVINKRKQQHSQLSSDSSLLTTKDNVDHQNVSIQKREDEEQQDSTTRKRRPSFAVAMRDDLYNMILLISLYTIQGVPIGLVFGSIPFLIQQNSSYTDLGIFSFASYPYSLKLLWSPIVDSVFIRSFGRRKSWIVPIQLIVGFLFLYISSHVDEIFHAQHIQISYLTGLFFVVILLTATQDIAVDGWALEILHKNNIGYASTCQSIGLSIGYFMSYTIFLALNSPEFSNAYLRSVPQSTGVLSIGGYLAFWGIVYIVFTVLLALFKHEKEIELEAADLDVASVYRHILSIIKLPAMQTYMIVLMICRLGFVVADSITPLKLVEKGFRKDNLAVLVTIAFPFEFLFAILAGKLSREGEPLKPWKLGYVMRAFIALAGVLLVYTFPQGGEVSLGYYALVLLIFLVYSLCSNFMVVAQGSFFAKIADPRIGGTYMTFLNTLANLGGTYPRFFGYYFIDLMTSKACVPTGTPATSESVTRWSCSTTDMTKSCMSGESCVTMSDGYYYLGVISPIVGIALFLFYINKAMNRLQKTKESSWLINRYE